MKMLRIDPLQQKWYMLCPFCRHSACLTAKRVKNLMRENCPDHAKVVESEIGPVAVVHALSPEGHYDANSTLQMLPTDMPDMVDALLDDVEELEAELAEAQTACKKLQKENERLRRDVGVSCTRARHH